MIVKKTNSSVSLEELFIDEKVSLFINSHDIKFDFNNKLQTTDIETKHHIIRELKSFNGKEVVKLSDLVFLVEEVKRIEKSLLLPDDNLMVIKEGEEIENETAKINNLFPENQELPAPKIKKAHALNEVILLAHKGEKQKFNRLPIAQEVWNALKKENEESEKAYDEEEIIQEIDSWIRKGAKIKWITHRENEKEMSRRTFENLISKLNNTQK